MRPAGSAARSRAALVTGASSLDGIGGQTALALARRGFDLVITYATRPEAAEEVAAHCRDAGAGVAVVRADVAQDDQCRRAVEEAVDHWGRLDALVNNAATTTPVPHADLDRLDADSFREAMAVNLIGVYQMTRAAAPHLRAVDDAAVVNISSQAGLTGTGSSIAYAASKGALNTLTLSLARVLAPVRVNALCPSGVLGEWTRRVRGDAGYEQRLRSATSTFPLRRPVLARDVAETAVWLIEGATVMTGEVLRMDAGRHLVQPTRSEG